MIIYLVKSISCLAILLFVYHLILEKEKMHYFNRFYLLGALLFSFIIPTITIYNESAQLIEPIINNLPDFSILNADYQPITKTSVLDFTVYLSVFYVLIISLLALRFIKNLITIINRVHINHKVAYKDAIIVLTDEKITPHTFLQYIFINSNDYFSQKVQKEILTHEYSHVNQKHSLDILFIELVQIICWFNPIIPSFKKAIQLNHEFLADSRVAKIHNNVNVYQHLLLNSVASTNNHALSSNLNFLLTQKRLLMMTKQRSEKKMVLKKLALIPLLTILVFLFTNKAESQSSQSKTIRIEKPEKEIQKKENSIEKEINSNDISNKNIKVAEIDKIDTPSYRILTSDKDSTNKEGKLISYENKSVQEKEAKDKLKSGYFKIKNETFFYVTKNGKTSYFNRYGQEVNKNGEIILDKNVENQTPNSDNKSKSGYFKIKNETFFYVTKNGKITYFNRYGQEVNKNGKVK